MGWERAVPLSVVREAQRGILGTGVWLSALGAAELGLAWNSQERRGTDTEAGITGRIASHHHAVFQSFLTGIICMK